MRFKVSRSISTFALVFATVLFTTGASVFAQNLPLQRPRITGISHVGYFVSDLPKALGFWHDLLGYDVAYDLKRPGTDQVRIAFMKINDNQHVELFTDPPPAPPNMMSHVCFTVDNLEQMRAYLR